MADWEVLVRLVDQTTPRPSITTLDTLLEERACANGHPQRVLGATVGHAHGSVDAALDLLARFATKAEPPGCKTCGAAVPAQGTAMLASYLPVAKADLLLAVTWDGARETALRPRETRAIGPLTEAARREFVAASCARTAVAPTTMEMADRQALLDRADAAWPGYPAAHKAAVHLALQRGDVHAARLAATRAVAADEDDAEAHFLLADLIDGDEPERALTHYERACALAPGDPLPPLHRGLVLKRLGRVDAARASYAAALKIDAHHAPTLVNAAVWSAQEDDFATAFARVEEIRPQDLRDSPPFAERAHAISMRHAGSMLADKQWSEAARAFEVASWIREEPRSLVGWAVALANAGAAPEALVRLQAALEMSPGDAEAKRLIAALERVGSRPAGGLLAMRSRRHVRYVDARGRDAVMLNFIVKLEASDKLVESEVACMSLSRDKDLQKLLVMKGHNRRVEGDAAKASLFDSVLGASPPRRDEARPFEIVVQTRPEAEFLAFAGARRWRSVDGREVASAPVRIVLDAHGSRTALEPPASAEAFVLAREPALEASESSAERFYPEAYAEY